MTATLNWSNRFRYLRDQSGKCLFYDDERLIAYEDALICRIIGEYYPDALSLDELNVRFRDRYATDRLVQCFLELQKEGLLVEDRLGPSENLPVSWPQIKERLGEDLAAFFFKLGSKTPSVCLLDDYINMGEALEAVGAKGKTLFIKPVGQVLLLGPYWDFSTGADIGLLRARLTRNSLWKEVIRQNVGCFAPPVFFNDRAWELLKGLLPGFIENPDAHKIILRLNVESAEVHSTELPDSLIYPPRKVQGYVFEDGRPFWKVDVSCAFSHHKNTMVGLLKKVSSYRSPLGGWVASGGPIFRSNQLDLDDYFNTVYASGNGSSPEEAEAGAFCETLERFSAIFREGDGYELENFNTINAKALDPSQLFLYSGRQFAEGQVCAEKGYALSRLNPETPISWSPVIGRSGKIKYMPTHLLYMGGPVEDKASARFFKWNTNGTAAGATDDMAKLLALYELIERDATAIWWYNQLPAKRICIEELEDGFIETVYQEHKLQNAQLFLFDITQDIQIKTVAAASSFLDGRFIVATGSNACLHKACRKAVSELCQLYFHHQYLIKKGIPNLVTAMKSPHFVPFEGRNVESIGPGLQKYFSCLKEELGFVERAIEERNLEIFYKDMTRADVELPVFKAIVPGMRNQYRQLGSGRLYDVPQKLYGIGHSEEGLNTYNLI